MRFVSVERPFGIVSSSSLLERVIEEGEKREQRKKQKQKEKVRFLGHETKVGCHRRRHKKKLSSKVASVFFFVFFLLSSNTLACFSTLQIRWDCERQNQKIPRTAPRTSSHKLPVDSECVALSFFFPLSLSLSLSLESEIVSFFFEMFSDALSYFSLTTHKAHE